MGKKLASSVSGAQFGFNSKHGSTQFGTGSEAEAGSLPAENRFGLGR